MNARQRARRGARSGLYLSSRLLMLMLALALLIPALAACGDDDNGSGDLHVDDAWARPSAAPAMEGASGAMGSPTAGTGSGTMSTPAATAAADAGTGSNSAAFMTIVNDSDSAERLVGAESDAAGTVEIHETTNDNGVMKMRPVEGGIEIAAGGEVELKPGGLHVMLIGVTSELTPGDTIELTLVFESGTRIELDEVEVREP